MNTTPRKNIRKIALCVAAALLLLAAAAAAALLIINAHVKSASRDRILPTEQAAALPDVDCVIVLGCRVNENGTVSDMLRDRLTCGIALYEAGAAPKLLMSGDHGKPDYNEVGAMKQFATDHGVPSENVFMDHAGFSTYETLYRAKAVFGARKILIVTQEYHLYRALYIAKQLGLDAYGVSADLHTYAGQRVRDLREVLARCKDFAKCLFMPAPTYLGDPIPLTGSGDLTNDNAE